jgi:hypothetical protein
MIHRRGFIAAAAVGAATAAAESSGLAFGNRAHIFARPSVKEKLIWCFSTVLGCGAPMSSRAPGLTEPILAFKFPGGGSLSAEFTEDALDERQMRLGAWVEIWSDDPAGLKKKVLDAGLLQVTYPATNTFYFAAPGGQILGIVSGRNPGAGELRGKR